MHVELAKLRQTHAVELAAARSAAETTREALAHERTQRAAAEAAPRNSSQNVSSALLAPRTACTSFLSSAWLRGAVRVSRFKAMFRVLPSALEGVKGHTRFLVSHGEIGHRAGAAEGSAREVVQRFLEGLRGGRS
ncbi:hypothetical protein J2853_002686 [Streptosporangium lutulentum]|uniref:Uncharacterized protein n=1 Tax=Streptosporangium lutulentum TaxID=1461250 RepID=A0ABT9Q9N4_9ACTN|nr:hypothetical protein [Streptosporangium lutulentum]